MGLQRCVVYLPSESIRLLRVECGVTQIYGAAGLQLGLEAGLWHGSLWRCGHVAMQPALCHDGISCVSKGARKGIPLPGKGQHAHV